jgi:predicted ribosome quality control (RQC) complex YloA/Tae2 family protein
MEIILDSNKTLDQNAAEYFEKAKKAKRKIEGIKKALAMFEKEKEELLAKKEKAVKEYEMREQEKKKPKREKQWYEKFRWFFSSEGFLCIGGRDSTTNDILVKKHMAPEDIVFHTEMPGSPFFIVKSEGRKIGEETLNETAQATAVFSRAWKMGIGSARVYWILPEQVSKEANSGEYLGKGSFMINGKRNISEPKMEMAVGLNKEGMIMAGPVNAVVKNCSKYVLLIQGQEKKTDIAKQVKKLIGGELDDIVSVLPAGEFEIKKR